MKKLLFTSILLLGAAAVPSQAGIGVSVQIGPQPRYYPRRVYVAPPPTYYVAPGPVYVAPPPYYGPGYGGYGPAYVAPRGYYMEPRHGNRHWDRRYRGGWR